MADQKYIEERGPWKVVSQEKAYESAWISVTHHEVIHPGNAPGIYGEVHFKNTAIGIVPLDADLNTWLVGQYRFPLNQYSWEIPEGGGKIGVDPLDSAKRELSEETGITAERWEVIQEIHLSNSVTDEYGLIYLARDLSFAEATPDADEDLKIEKVPFEDFYQRVVRGEITDSLSVAAALKVKLMLLEGQL